MKFTNEQIEQGLDKIFDNLLQTKDVEASESMEITPDEGFLGLKKVNVTVKDTGGDAPSGGSNLQYFDLSNIVAGKTTIVSTATLIKTNDYNEIVTLGLRCTNNSIFDIVNVVTAIAVDVNRKMIMEGETMTVGDFLSLLTGELGTTLPSITEEQFYNLNA